MTIEITLDRTQTFEQVNKITSYIGSKTKSDQDMMSYAVIATTSYNDELLQNYYDDALNSLATLFKPFLSTTAVEDARTTFTLEMPSNFAAVLLDSLQKEVNSFVVDFILSLWLTLCGAPAEMYAKKAAASLEAISVKLYTRVAPQYEAPAQQQP